MDGDLDLSSTFAHILILLDALSSYQDVCKLADFAPDTSDAEKSIHHLMFNMAFTPTLDEYAPPLSSSLAC